MDQKHMGSSSSNSSSTTFVQADANTFRELVQKLTGADDNAQDKLPLTLPARHSPRSPNFQNDVTGPRRSPFKLQERRQNMRKLEIKLGHTSIRQSSHSPRQLMSPVTPLGSDTVFSSRFPGSGCSSPGVEERAIAEKGYYLHPSPLSTPRGTEPPELLTLFPLESPK